MQFSVVISFFFFFFFFFKSSPYKATEGVDVEPVRSLCVDLLARVRRAHGFPLLG